MSGLFSALIAGLEFSTGSVPALVACLSRTLVARLETTTGRMATLGRNFSLDDWISSGKRMSQRTITVLAWTDPYEQIHLGGLRDHPAGRFLIPPRGVGWQSFRGSGWRTLLLY